MTNTSPTAYTQPHAGAFVNWASEHPYASFLHSVSKPTRYTGAEFGARPKDWRSVEARVCLAFPDIYDIGMSHLGFRILYQLLNDDVRTLAERCYMPWTDAYQAIKQHGEFLRALESQRPLCDFDVVGFSLQYELTYTNILAMLDLSGIPLRSEQRGEDDPLILAGGPVATHPEPIAPFLDAIVIGDGEEVTTEVALSWARGKRAGLARSERLLELAKLGGVYVPALYATTTCPDTGFLVVDRPLHPDAPLPIQRRLIEDLSRFPFPDSGPVGGPQAIFDRMSIEVARGCTEGCRFCQAGMIYRPVRERDPEEVLRTVQRALEKSGQDEVSLTALSTADVSCISPLIKSLVKKTAPERVSLSVASLRAYGMPEDLLDEMRRVRASGLTFAPEAGTQRMRDVINKNVTEEQLLQTAERVFSRGFDKMKLYFMIGLPTEADEDVVGIVEVGKRALAVGKRLRQSRARVTVSVSTHVPKPHTPFQWCAMDALPEVRRKQALLRERASCGARALKLRLHGSESSVLEGVLARGDRSLASVIERAYARGAQLDAWEEEFKVEIWEEALTHFQVDRSRFLGTIPVDARLPWDHVAIGLEDGFLQREYRKALKGRLSPPCGKVAGTFVHHTQSAKAILDQRRLVCYDCGIACDLTHMREERLVKLRVLEDHLGQSGPEPATPDTNTIPVVASNTEAPDAMPSSAMPSAAQQTPEALRPKQTGGERERWRLRFTKRGPLALLGHLDLIRELPRVVRRAGVHTAYSRGFNPKPEMSFAPALALGVESLDEYVDLTLLEVDQPEGLLERLNQACPPGLQFLQARRLLPGERSITRRIVAARYALVIGSQTVEREFGGLAGLEARVERFLAAERVPMERVQQKRRRVIDARALVQRVVVESGELQASAGEPGLPAHSLRVVVDVRLSAEGSLKPTELAPSVLGKTQLPHRVLRVALLSEQDSPMLPDPELASPKPFARRVAADVPIVHLGELGAE